MRFPVWMTVAGLLVMVSITSADPSTRPASSATQPACDVYLAPFSSIGGDNSLEWAGRAVVQNLLTDLAHTTFVRSQQTIRPPDQAIHELPPSQQGRSI